MSCLTVLVPIISKRILFIFQLNYNENLTRFFNSQPRTHPDKEAGDAEEKDDYKPYSSGNVGESRFESFCCLRLPFYMDQSL